MVFLLRLANSVQLTSHRADFQRALHDWYRINHRKLPWREAPSLYKTVVSEFMLQQTQVVTVLPYFERWHRELPDFAALAAASEAKVIKLWEGLGYYSRARNLHKLAQAIAALPNLPRSTAEWQELPGIGPYTAAAIASISLGQPAACVDGNVVRILARLTAETQMFRDSATAAKYFTPLADELIAGSHPGTHNQAMMELGATVCVRAKPLCPVCPVAVFCVARRNGEPEKIPRFQSKQMEQRSVARVWCEHRGRLLLKRGHATARRLAGLYELPDFNDFNSQKPEKKSLIAVKRRTITRFQISESIYRVSPSADQLKEIKTHEGMEWVPLNDIARLTLSGPHKRWIAELLAQRNVD